MKNLILFAVLAVLLVGINGAEVESTDVSKNIDFFRKIDLGTVTAADTVVYRNWFNWPGFPDMIFDMDVQYRGSRPITAIQVTEVDNNLYSHATLIAGGLGQTFATIRLGSARSHAYWFRVEIWAR